MTHYTWHLQRSCLGIKEENEAQTYHVILSGPFPIQKPSIFHSWSDVVGSAQAILSIHCSIVAKVYIGIIVYCVLFFVESWNWIFKIL